MNDFHQTLLNRLELAREALDAGGLDALVVTSPLNRHYLTGFSGSSGLALVTPKDARLLTDSRYYGQVEREVPHFKLERVGYQTFDTLGEIADALGLHRIGFEADAVTVGQLETMQKKLPDVDWTATSGLLEAYRMVKSPEEMATIMRAVRLADEAMEHAYAVAQPGMTEAALAWAIERFMREHGASGVAFELIVAAGENGAMPHHRPTDRVIALGEPIVVDIGCTVDAYNSDLTRTFSLGPANDPDYLAVYACVLEALETAVAGLRSGLTGVAGDALARDVIKAAGYGDYFGHSLGHGVGMNVHEGPRLSFSPENTSVLAPGHVVTVEPGIYLPGRFGVRIEDMVHVTADGVETLTGVRKLPVLER